MRLYEINEVSPNALVAITLERGKHICCSVNKLYKSYTESPSKNRLKRDGHITSVVFYNERWIDNQLINIPLPLEEADWDSGMQISPENFTNILKYIVCGMFRLSRLEKYSINDFNPESPTADEKRKLYDNIRLLCDMPREEFNSYNNPFVDCCDEFLEMLYNARHFDEVFSMLLKAKELSI